MSKSILKVKNLKQYFNVNSKNMIKAVDGISFEVKEGEVHGIVGESGCGKTTTGRSILKIYQITGGEVEFNGKTISIGIEEHKINISNKKDEYKLKIANEVKKNVKRKKQITKSLKTAETELDITKLKNELDELTVEIKEVKEKLKKELAAYITVEKEIIEEKKSRDVKVDKDFMKDIQMIFQDPIESLNPRMTIGEIISEGLVINEGGTKEELQVLVEESLAKVGLLPEHASRYPHEFSGGQRQRIGIARALILKPSLIVADEPISALDVSIQAQVISLLETLREEYNLTILFIAHDLSVVKYFCDNITVMYFGKIVETGSGDKLFANPTHPYTQSLLSAIPIPDPIYQRTRTRISYDPKSHDKTEEPELRELSEGHFVLATTKEFKEYKKNYK